MKCPKCGSDNTVRNGFNRGKQTFRCKDCIHYWRESTVSNNKPSKVMGIPINEFRKKHDVNFILTQVFEKLEDEMFYEKSDIIKMTGLRPGYPGFATVLESGEFKKYQGRAGGQTYYAKPGLINQMKEEGILS